MTVCSVSSLHHRHFVHGTMLLTHMWRDGDRAGELRACANPIETKSLCAWELLDTPEYDSHTEFFHDAEEDRCPVMFFGADAPRCFARFYTPRNRCFWVTDCTQSISLFLGRSRSARDRDARDRFAVMVQSGRGLEDCGPHRGPPQLFYCRCQRR
jgi:hypothetical protein